MKTLNFRTLHQQTSPILLGLLLFVSCCQERIYFFVENPDPIQKKELTLYPSDSILFSGESIHTNLKGDSVAVFRYDSSAQTVHLTVEPESRANLGEALQFERIEWVCGQDTLVVSGNPELLFSGEKPNLGMRENVWRLPNCPH